MGRGSSVKGVTARAKGRPKVPREVREREMLRVATRAFAQRGFHAASVDAIAEGAGISKPMVYAYFGSKEGLYRACMVQARERLFETLRRGVDGAAAPDQQLWHGLLAFFTFVRERRDAWAVLVGDVAGALAADGAEVRREAGALIATLLRQVAVDEGVDPASLELIDPLARALVGSAESLTEWWEEHPEHPPERVALTLMNFAWNGLGDLVRGGRWLPAN
jgi:AcrR family transcriptional regulator